jgi:uncharacterized protein (TIRG00374 family)
MEHQPPDNKPRRSVWSWIVAAAFAAVLLYFSLRGIEWGRVWEATLHARWRYLGLSSLMATVTFFLRSLRWRLLLNAQGSIGVGTVFWANMAGYLGNNFLPARAGEIVRTLLISERSPLSKTYVLTTAITERLLDAVTLVLCGSVALLDMEQKPAWMHDAGRSIAAAAIAGVVAIAALPYLEGFAVKLLRRLPLPEGIRLRLLGLIEQVTLGLRAFHRPSRLAGFVALTAVIWTMDTVGTMVATQALGLDVSFSLALLLIVGLGLGSALPSTPGYVGIYQFVAITVLTPFGIDRNDALAYIILWQAAAYILVLALGSAGLYRLRRNKIT